jgi:hypothetical protein
MYYTIYKTTNLITNKIYIGQHITNNFDDGYLGSGKNLKHDIKKYGKENFTKEILFIFDNFDDMDNKEKELVTKEFVLREDTYNLIQGGLQFNTSGQTIVKDKDGNNQLVYLNDPRYLSGELVGVTKGKVVVRDKNGITSQIAIDDPRYLSGELIPITTGKVIVKDKDGNTLYVSTDDERYLNGELVSIIADKVLVKDKDGNRLHVDKDDPRYISGELVGITKDMILVKDPNNSEKNIYVTNEEYKNGNYESFMKGRVLVKDPNNPSKKIHITQEEFNTGNYEGITKGMFLAKNVKTGIIEYINKDDPRILSGEYVGKNAGKKYIHNDKLQQKKMINGEEYKQFLIDNPDWQPGFKNYKEKIPNKMIHKDGVMIRIHPNELEQYISDGWKLGMTNESKKNISNYRKNTICISKNNIVKYIKESEIQNYLNDNWILGNIKNKTNKVVNKNE